MNLKHLSMTALAAVFLFSCSNDKENIPTVPEEDTKVPVTINVDFGDVYSRAVTFPGNTATDNEKRLTNVAVSFLITRNSWKRMTMRMKYATVGSQIAAIRSNLKCL